MHSDRAVSRSIEIVKSRDPTGSRSLSSPQNESPHAARSLTSIVISAAPLSERRRKDPPHRKLTLKRPSPVSTTMNRPTGKGGETSPSSSDSLRSADKYQA